MNWQFKYIGLIMIFISAALTGVLKASKLKLRVKKMSELYLAMSNLKERIRSEAGEIAVLIKKSFNDQVIYNGEHFRINKNDLEADDLKLFDEFFDDIGMTDRTSERERINLYMSLLLKKCEEADIKAKELYRLYLSLGVLIGVFICIFFL